MHHFRFFFTHKHEDNEDAQIPKKVIASILKRTLSDVICDNTNSKHIPVVPKSAFVISTNGEEKQCDSDTNQLNFEVLVHG